MQVELEICYLSTHNPWGQKYTGHQQRHVPCERGRLWSHDITTEVSSGNRGPTDFLMHSDLLSTIIIKTQRN